MSSTNSLERDLRSEQITESEMKNRLMKMGYPSNSDPRLDYKTAIQDKFYVERLKAHLRANSESQDDISFSRTITSNTSTLKTAGTLLHSTSSLLSDKENAHPNSQTTHGPYGKQVPQPNTPCDKEKSGGGGGGVLAAAKMYLTSATKRATLNATQQNVSAQYFGGGGGGGNEHFSANARGTVFGATAEKDSAARRNTLAARDGGSAHHHAKTPKFSTFKTDASTLPQSPSSQSSSQQYAHRRSSGAHNTYFGAPLIEALQKTQLAQYLRTNEHLAAIGGKGLAVIGAVVLLLLIFATGGSGGSGADFGASGGSFSSSQGHASQKMAPPPRGDFCANDLSRENQRALGCTPCPANAICKGGEAHCKDAFYLLSGECVERAEVQADALVYLRQVADKLRVINGEEFCQTREQGYMSWKHIYQYLKDLHASDNFFPQKIDRTMDILLNDADGARSALQIELSDDRFFTFQRTVSYWCEIGFFFEYNYIFFRNMVYFAIAVTVGATIAYHWNTLQQKAQQFFGRRSTLRFLVRIVRRKLLGSSTTQGAGAKRAPVAPVSVNNTPKNQ